MSEGEHHRGEFMVIGIDGDKFTYDGKPLYLKCLQYLPANTDRSFVETIFLNVDEYQLRQDLSVIRPYFNTIRLIYPNGDTDAGLLFSDGRFIDTSLVTNLKRYVDIIIDEGFFVDLTLFGWRKTGESPEHKYSSQHDDGHRFYLNYIIDLLSHRFGKFFISLSNELNNEPFGAWTGSSTNRSMMIDWAYRMQNEIPMEVLFTVGMTNPTNWQYEEDYFRTPDWGGASIYDMVDFISPHFYNPYNIDGKGDIQNKTYYYQVMKGVTKPIYIQEIGAENEADLTWLLTQIKRSNVAGFGIWEFTNHNAGNFGIFENGQLKYNISNLL